jgi:hypothetical protein
LCFCIVWHATNLISWKTFFFSEVFLFYNFWSHCDYDEAIKVENYFGKLNINHYHHSLTEENYFLEDHFDVSYACWLFKNYIFLVIIWVKFGILFFLSFLLFLVTFIFRHPIILGVQYSLFKLRVIILYSLNFFFFWMLPLLTAVSEEWYGWFEESTVFCHFVVINSDCVLFFFLIFSNLYLHYAN